VPIDRSPLLGRGRKSTPVIQLCCPAIGMAGNALRHLQRFSILQVRRDARRPEGVRGVSPRYQPLSIAALENWLHRSAS